VAAVGEVSAGVVECGDLGDDVDPAGPDVVQDVSVDDCGAVPGSREALEGTFGGDGQAVRSEVTDGQPAHRCQPSVCRARRQAK